MISPVQDRGRTVARHRHTPSVTSSVDGSTPAVTEGSSAVDTEVETELDPTDNELADSSMELANPNEITSLSSSMRSSPRGDARLNYVSTYDLMNRYFRKDPTGFANLDLFR